MIFFDLPLKRYPHEQLLTRAFELAYNLTIYDALYVVLAEALAEALDATLLTRDNAMKDVPGTMIQVKVIGK